MSDEYTPTTEEVREDYSNGVWNDGMGSTGTHVEAAFDRWLAKEREKAWSEGYSVRAQVGVWSIRAARFSSDQPDLGYEPISSRWSES